MNAVKSLRRGRLPRRLNIDLPLPCAALPSAGLSWPPGASSGASLDRVLEGSVLVTVSPGMAF